MKTMVKTLSDADQDDAQCQNTRHFCMPPGLCVMCDRLLLKYMSWRRYYNGLLVCDPFVIFMIAMIAMMIGYAAGTPHRTGYALPPHLAAAMAPGSTVGLINL